MQSLVLLRAKKYKTSIEQNLTSYIPLLRCVLAKFQILIFMLFMSCTSSKNSSGRMIFLFSEDIIAVVSFLSYVVANLCVKLKTTNDLPILSSFFPMYLNWIIFVQKC